MFFLFTVFAFFQDEVSYRVLNGGALQKGSSINVRIAVLNDNRLPAQLGQGFIFERIGDKITLRLIGACSQPLSAVEIKMVFYNPFGDKLGTEIFRDYDESPPGKWDRMVVLPDPLNEYRGADQVVFFVSRVRQLDGTTIAANEKAIFSKLLELDLQHYVFSTTESVGRCILVEGDKRCKNTAVNSPYCHYHSKH